MIKQEYYSTRTDGVRLYRTYSTDGYYIQRNDGVIYVDAVDPEGSEYIYAETDELIPEEPHDADELAEAWDILVEGQ